jgi:hypothetical protein
MMLFDKRALTPRSEWIALATRMQSLSVNVLPGNADLVGLELDQQNKATLTVYVDMETVKPVEAADKPKGRKSK